MFLDGTFGDNRCITGDSWLIAYLSYRIHMSGGSEEMLKSCWVDMGARAPELVLVVIVGVSREALAI